MHRQLGDYLFSSGEDYGMTAQHICKTLYRSVFDSYQNIDYSLRPWTAHCAELWCQSIVGMLVEK